MAEKLFAEWFSVDRWNGSSAKGLPIECRGIYREMLSQAWIRGAQLPNDHRKIRSICGIELDEWERCWPQVEEYWVTTEDNLFIYNGTQTEVYIDAKQRHINAQARAQAGAQARHKQVLKQCSPSPSPSPSPSLSSTENSGGLIFQLYEENIGILTPLLSQELGEYTDCQDDWLTKAFEIAATNNVRKWKYIKAILDDWMAKGQMDTKPKGNGQQPATDDIDPEEYISKYAHLTRKG